MIYSTDNIDIPNAVYQGTKGVFSVYAVQNKFIEQIPEIILKPIDKEPNQDRYLPYLFEEGKAIQHYTLDIPKDIFETVEDLLIGFRFNGDTLQVCCEDELLGDCFNYCETYEVGKTIEIRCSPLRGDEWVYLEIETIQPLYWIKG